MNYVIVDLEATCREGGSDVADMEIIEIGAVLLDGRSFQPVADFGRFVRPTNNPALSEFCLRLTHIKQSQVDAAPHFPEAFHVFLGWIGEGPFKLCSWGRFDYELFLTECRRHGRSFPCHFVGHLNLKELFARAYSTRTNIGLPEAMRKLGLPFEGRHHRGIDDARNIARVAESILILDE